MAVDLARHIAPTVRRIGWKSKGARGHTRGRGRLGGAKAGMRETVMAAALLVYFLVL